MRIYELLFKVCADWKREISVDDLRAYCGIEESEYALYGDFKRYAVNRAQNEINAKTDYDVNYSEKKKARKVVGLNFSFEKEACSLTGNKTALLEEECLPVSRIFNEITGAQRRVSTIKEQELLRVIKSHNLPGHLLENWRTGLTNAMSDLFLFR